MAFLLGRSLRALPIKTFLQFPDLLFDLLLSIPSVEENVICSSFAWARVCSPLRHVDKEISHRSKH